MGLIYWVARAAAEAPGLANFLTQTPGVSQAVRAMGGLTTGRPMPPFAALTFREWRRRRARNGVRTAGVRGKVLLWPDTFTNHFEPHIAAAAQEVLEDAGYEVLVPRRPLCCGRPLYDYGMLDLARRQLRQILDVMRDEIRAGIPVVGLEPSCISVFRDEMEGILKGDMDAGRLARQAFMLEEFLMGKASGYAPPRLETPLLLHGHCHEKAVLGMESQRKLLDAMGADWQAPDGGCCGLAGSFGFEAEKFGVSMAVGELKLLPAVRKLPAGALTVSNGFSCRHQIRMVPGQRPMHVAELLHRASRGAQAQERLAEEFASAAKRARRRFHAAAAAAGLAGAAWLGRRLRDRRA
jgi:Fe-S oxidoreductase